MRGARIIAWVVGLGLLWRYFRPRGNPSTVAQRGRDHSPLRETEAARLLRDYLNAAFDPRAAAKRQLEESLAELRRNPEAVIEEISLAFSELSPREYNFRWALVYCAAELNHPAALNFLHAVVQLPIPPEESKDIHHFSSVGEETAIRMRALGGVEKLARAGDEEVRRFLFGYLRSPSFSLRVAATQALLGLDGGENERDRIAAGLPRGERFILDIRRMSTPEVVRMRPQDAERMRGERAAKPSQTGAATSRIIPRRRISSTKPAPRAKPIPEGESHGRL